MKKYSKHKSKFKVFKLDICSEKEVLKVYNEIINKFNKIDILINNAAIDYKPKKKERRKEGFLIHQLLLGEMKYQLD